MGDVLDDCVHRFAEEDLVFVVPNEELELNIGTADMLERT